MYCSSITESPTSTIRWCCKPFLISGASCFALGSVQPEELESCHENARDARWAEFSKQCGLLQESSSGAEWRTRGHPKYHLLTRFDNCSLLQPEE